MVRYQSREIAGNGGIFELPKSLIGKIFFWLLVAAMGIGTPLFAVYYFQSNSTIREYADCTVEDTHILQSNHRYGSRESLAIRTSCGEFEVNRNWATKLFPGDTVELTVKYMPGSNRSVENLTITASENTESAP